MSQLARLTPAHLISPLCIFFCLIFQLQDCIQAALGDWLTSAKLPSEVGEPVLVLFVAVVCVKVQYVVQLHTFHGGVI